MAGYTFSDIMNFTKGTKKSTTRKDYSSKRDVLAKEKHGKVGVYLWGNRIAMVSPKRDGVSVSSAGWHTKTTKQRINRVIGETGHGVVQEKGRWYLTTPSGKKVPFKDNMRIR